jgi:hypothetical protein
MPGLVEEEHHQHKQVDSTLWPAGAQFFMMSLLAGIDCRTDAAAVADVVNGFVYECVTGENSSENGGASLRVSRACYSSSLA